MAVGSLGLRGAGLVGGATLRGAGHLGGVIARYPATAGGTMAFAVIFSFIATNALWYQPGNHPSPFFRTRDASSPYQLAGRKPFSSARHDPADTTTFRIERPDDTATSAPPAPAAAAPVATAQAPVAEPGNVVSQVQAELVRRGLYNGAADGIIGPRTTAAILSFEQSAGLKQTGEASEQLLAALKADAKPGVAVPAEKPPADISSNAAAADPVAAAIMSSEKDVKTASVRTASATPAKKPVPDPVANATMVMQIQKGLSNIAYSNVSVDGVAGESTRTAILHFQKHYRLPETGEPDGAVLKNSARSAPCDRVAVVTLLPLNGSALQNPNQCLLEDMRWLSKSACSKQTILPKQVWSRSWRKCRRTTESSAHRRRTFCSNCASARQAPKFWLPKTMARLAASALSVRPIPEPASSPAYS